MDNNGQKRTPHKHAEVIKAWADGAKVQTRMNGGTWFDLHAAGPCWHLDWEYRIKPEPIPDIKTCLVLKVEHPWRHVSIYSQWQGEAPVGYSHQKPTLGCTFDGETGKLKSVEIVE